MFKQLHERFTTPESVIGLFMAITGSVAVGAPIGVLLGVLTPVEGNLFVAFLAFLGIVYIELISPHRDSIPSYVTVIFFLLMVVPMLYSAQILITEENIFLYSMGMTSVSALIVLFWWVELARSGEELHTKKLEELKEELLEE